MNCPHCNVHIDEHEAGSKTNMCVAVVVFGKNEHYYDCPHFSESGRLLSFCSCPDLPCYSTSISAAWEVVEKYLPYFRIENHEESDYTGTGWHADFWLDSGHGCAKGCDTAPLAICRAAIKSVHIAITEPK